MHTQPQLKKVPEMRPFLHIRKIALFNEDQLNRTSFYLGSHNRLDNKLPFFFTVNYWRNQPHSQRHETLPRQPTQNPGRTPQRQSPRPHQNPPEIGVGLQSSPTPTEGDMSQAGPLHPLRPKRVELFQPGPGLHSQASPVLPAPRYFKNCVRTPRGHRCNQEIQLNNPGPLLLPQTAFFPPPNISFSKFLFKKEKKKETKNQTEEQQEKKKRGGKEKKETVLLSFPCMQGN